MDVTPDGIRTGPLSLDPASIDILSYVTPAVRGEAPGPGSVTVALAGPVEQVVTLAVRVGGLALGGVAGVGGAGVAGGNIAGATHRTPSVDRRSGNQAVHEPGNVLELVTNSARYRLTQVPTIAVCWRPTTAAGTPSTTTVVTTVVPVVCPRTGQEEQEEQ